jgi:hypothetical protein
MRRILTEVWNGSFTRGLAGELGNGKANFTRRRVGEQTELIGPTWAKLRPLMSWAEEPRAAGSGHPGGGAPGWPEVHRNQGTATVATICC